jgi:nitroimidazol reductase NimA-like FMN-containing flavoprotein (pyridoxamine 5'-phosphate oxidase superfamily)
MLGELSRDQIQQVLQSQIVGRIGCCFKNEMYVVPVTYAIHKEFIYAHSKEGLKVQMMRKNPHVCFQVDSIDNMTNWRSVLLWGDFEELKTEKEQRMGMKILADRLTPYMISETVRPAQSPHPPDIIEKEFKALAYRIRIIKTTGRFEKTILSELHKNNHLIF